MSPKFKQEPEDNDARSANEERSDSITEKEEAGSEQEPPTTSTSEDNVSGGIGTAPDTLPTSDEIMPEEISTEQWLEKLAAAEALAAERLDGQQRSLADFQNYKRRTTRDNQLIRQNTAATLLARFFPILDDLALALDSLPTTGDGAAWSEGVSMVHRKLMAALEGEGVTIIKAEPGQEFDPHFHEAIAHENHSDYDDDLIIEVVRAGYQLDERILRPAQVRVAK